MAHATIKAEGSGSDAVVFTTKVTVRKEADMFTALARAYFEKFGLRDEKIVRQFTLFANQYRNETSRRDNELTIQAEDFRSQQSLIEIFKRQLDSSNRLIASYDITINVKQWFLERIKQFGIQYILGGDVARGGNGDVHLMNIEPIPMIDKTDLQRGDIFLIDGGSVVSQIIKFGTWSRFSHTAIYDNFNDRVYESLGDGVNVTPFQEVMDNDPVIGVMRSRLAFPSAADKAVAYARRSAGLDGGHKVPYDIPGAIASGTPWILALGFPPLLSNKIGSKIDDAVFGHQQTFFCSEMVCTAYEEAGMSISDASPQDTFPGALSYSSKLFFVGFLKCIV